MNDGRIFPLMNVIGYWDHDLGGYPERIRLAMSDGKIVTYVLDVRQPAPQIRTEYAAKHAKKAAGVGAPDGCPEKES